MIPRLSLISDDGRFRIWAIEPYITSLDGGNTATHLIEENYRADNHDSPGNTHTYWLGISGNDSNRQWVGDYQQESLAQVCEKLGIEGQQDRGIKLSDLVMGLIAKAKEQVK